ncbi:hypothetical protein [Streptomyces griseofuscus]|uniref:hypothetical protein n=1 Tax=Streptomyces griseofuscus TaxID=146922 RepID=UPI00155A2830|nr:hypothetical protein [Streptomyces griseofuscus]
MSVSGTTASSAGRSCPSGARPSGTHRQAGHVEGCPGQRDVDQSRAQPRAEEDRFAARPAETEALEAEVEARTTAQSPRFGLYATDLGLRTHQMLRQWPADTAEDLERRAGA